MVQTNTAPSTGTRTSTSTREPPPASADSSSLSTVKTNLSYLAFGSAASAAPASLGTRSFLTTTRYILRYVIRRLMRYAKYAAVGAVAAAVGGTLLGTMGSGLAFFAAPGILGGMGIGLASALAKFGWRHRGDHLRGGIWEGFQARAAEGRDGAADEKMDSKRRSEEVKQKRNDVWMRA